MSELPTSPEHHPLRPTLEGAAQTTLTVLGDKLQVLIPLRGRGLGRLAWHRARPRRYDDQSIGMARGDRAGDVVPVVRPVARERRDWTRDLVEQGADL